MFVQTQMQQAVRSELQIVALDIPLRAVTEQTLLSLATTA
jgi:hypothetical protein